ncbi:MAG: pentapeptide repeat-containing protein [Pleurocapsa sp. CRU_1_2]|nr:pentapeptide repeat-containing protein [Pleurocapsa sp. CRU_1_2]
MTVDELLSRYAAGERNFSAIKFIRNVESRRGRVDLRGADLRGINLSGSDLLGASLSGANLSSANLSGANLSGAILKEANLDGVIAVGTLFKRTGLILSSFRDADLTGATFLQGGSRCADFTGASMRDVTMVEYIVDGCDFSNVDLEFATIIKVDFSKAEVRGFFTCQQAFFWQVTLPNGVYVEGPMFNE